MRPDYNIAAAKHFEDRAEAWRDFYSPEHGWSPSFHTRLLAVRWHLDQIAGKYPLGVAVDLGCGAGPYLPVLATQANKIVGIDIAASMIREARKSFPPDSKEIHLVRGSVTHLPFPDGHFDVGVCVGVIEYFNDPSQVLREAFRIMKAGGHIVFTFPNCLGLLPVSGLPRTLTLLLPPRWKVTIVSVISRMRSQSPNPSAYYLGACFTKRRIRSLCRKEGLAISQMTCSGYHDFRIFGLPLPHNIASKIASVGEKRRHDLPWRFCGNNIIVTIMKP